MAGPPSRPTEVFGGQDDGAVLVCWRASVPDGTPVTGYTVTASPGGLSATVAADRSSCFLEGLTNGTEYFFSVTAHSAAGDSPTGTSGFSTTPSPEDDDDELTWSEVNDAPGIRQRIRSLVGDDRWGVHRTDNPAEHLTLRVKDLTDDEREDLLAALGPQRALVSIETTAVSLVELDHAREAVRRVVAALPSAEAFSGSEEDPASQTIRVRTWGDDGDLRRALRAAIPDHLLSFTSGRRRWVVVDAGREGGEAAQPS